jgi:uncharacterized protein (DUF2062 family)
MAEAEAAGAGAAPEQPAARRGWLRRHLPTRDTIDGYRILRPFAKRLRQPNLWHLNHRSVPRGLALGLGVGVIIPFMHIPVAALLAIPARANVMIAAGSTLVVNPLTIPPMYYAAYRIGLWELGRKAADLQLGAAGREAGELDRFLFWIHHAFWPIVLGILTLSATVAALGYFGGTVGWQMRVRAKWRRRRGTRPA